VPNNNKSVANKKRSDEMTCFLNVDLDVVAAQDLSPLVHALGPRVFDLHTGPAGTGYQTHLELASRRPGDPPDAEAAIKAFVKLLASLPPRARRLWSSATQRDFNIGIQGGSEPRAFEFALQPATLKAVARLGARVVVTVYAVDTEYLQRPRRCGKRP
jgi:hypothetical protein